MASNCKAQSSKGGGGKRKRAHSRANAVAAAAAVGSSSSSSTSTNCGSNAVSDPSSPRKKSKGAAKLKGAGKQPSAGNPNHQITAPIVGKARSEVAEALEQLKAGKVEAIIIDAGLSLAFDGEDMVRYWNARATKQHRVPVPASAKDLSLKTYGGLPGIQGGMWHAYATSAHDNALNSPVIDQLFTEMTGTAKWQVRPERLRFNPVDKDDGHTSAHIEGEHVMRDTSDVGCIVCQTAGRTFTYYEGSNNDPRARKLFRELGGVTTHFVKPTQHQLRHWRRVTIKTTKPGQVILFAGSVAHEVSRLSVSLSLFLSPYDPAKDTDTQSRQYYQGLARTQALAKQKAHTSTAPLLPVQLMTDGQKRQHPKEFAGLTRREADIFGSLFHIAGCYWPSGKATFFLFHMMAFNAFRPKLLPFMFDAQGRYNYEVITPDLVQGCADFDAAYFDGLPLAKVTDAELQRMRQKYTGIPEAAWKLARYWTKDPRKCSDAVARRRGYLPF